MDCIQNVALQSGLKKLIWAFKFQDEVIKLLLCPNFFRDTVLITLAAIDYM